MRNFKLGSAVLSVCVALLLVSIAHAAPQDASFAGTWTMTMQGGGMGGGGGQGGEGGQGGQGGGGHRGGGRGGPQTLTIAQDGGKFKVTHATPRGDKTSDATVEGSTISWTEQREGRNGNTMTIQYKATLSGDTLKGTMGGGEFSRDFTATRTK
jgi:hypothetical protein